MADFAEELVVLISELVDAFGLGDFGDDALLFTYFCDASVDGDVW